MTEETCPWSIQIGTADDLRSRCDQPRGHSGRHIGPGLPQYPYQRVTWVPGDRREYTGRWPGWCEDFAVQCWLPKGHAGKHAP